MIEVTRRFEISAAHRLLGHEGKCAHLHGHNYVIEVSVAPQPDRVLDAVGRVIDFATLKQGIGRWLDTHWDHSILCSVQDEMAADSSAVLPQNPTAEHMALHLLDVVLPELLPAGVRATRVRVQETPNCWATATKDDE
jgi:6-pyruvoyltetrahydropterin/6-carboxytetrahydropterin synthase